MTDLEQNTKMPASASREPTSWRGWIERELAREGSCISAGLIRIFIALNLMVRWCEDLLLYRATNPPLFAVSCVFFVVTFLMLIGLWSRVSTVLSALCALSFVAYFGEEAAHEKWQHHHCAILMIGTFLTAFLPCERSLSVDAWLNQQKHGGTSTHQGRGPMWALWLFRIQLSTIYFWTAFDKCYIGFFRGDRLEGYFRQYYLGSDAMAGQSWSFVWPILSVSTVLLEFALVLLVIPRFRKWLLPMGIAMHGIFYTFLPIATFTTTMWTFYVALFTPDEVGRTVRRLL